MWYTVSTHHLSNHGEVRASMLIDSQQIHHPDEPEDDVQTVTDASCRPVGVRMPAHCQSSQEEEDGNEIWDVPVFWEPNLQLLAQLPRLRHKYLINRYIFGYFLLCSIKLYCSIKKDSYVLYNVLSLYLQYDEKENVLQMNTPLHIIS